MKRLRTFVGKIGPALAVLLIVVGFSAFHARRACDEIVRSEIAPPPRYSTRFVLHPSRHMGGAHDLGLKPGWVVIYAPRSKDYGTAFFVSFLGKILARGTPDIITRQHSQDQAALGKFRAAFAQLDAAVQVGSPFSNVVSLLGSPHTTFTNGDGSLSVFYHYMEWSLPPVDWLTNGFSLTISNGVVVRKGYSYSSSR